MSAVTQKQIATRLGISACMVGRALRNDPAYSLETRERIQKVAREMGYHAGLNQNARQMAGRRHGRSPRLGTIGLIAQPHSMQSLPYYAHLHAGITRAAHDLGHEVLHIPEEPSPGWSKVDGVLGFAGHNDTIVGRIAADLPYVSLGLSTAGTSCVQSDDASGVTQALDHLFQLGHRHIGYLLDAVTDVMQARLATYRGFLMAHGIFPQPIWQWDLFNWGPMENRGCISMHSWLDHGFLDTGVTALLVQNDRSAIGAMESLRVAGLKVPDDVSVLGYDGTDECRLSSPHLSSVAIPLEEMGARAVEQLLQHIESGDSTPVTVTLPVALHLRASTAPPRANTFGPIVSSRDVEN